MMYSIYSSPQPFVNFWNFAFGSYATPAIATQIKWLYSIPLDTYFLVPDQKPHNVNIWL
ncbi:MULTISPECIES: hypothetical protein [unclassified Nodularia (in: cyanobacteria)]|uniref:hypothetical protein n=1 Tax=unclassified Nodularia (in: cyanobacteria) TaxID=2656917 RepID=UPI00188274A6|nr:MULTISPECIES: hypothetical protein [unclassified Nodularia (in: cyanobacteria)]MBE9201343.1 hypothetical protein [Nodularia sp. LEGE 06071]MCC2695557.1 hypothetical protein [Nodularia sp. LEGE 04288]